jgi:adenylate kinase family enzyme
MPRKKATPPPPSGPPDLKENKVINFYEILPNSLKPKYSNPHYKDHLLPHPMRLLCIGASGSGKTTIAITIIAKMKDTFDFIILCCENANEPLYAYLKSKIPEEQLKIHEGIENLPNFDELDEESQILAIFDDLCLAKNQDKIKDLFIRGRKLAGGVSLMYLSQSYFAIPKVCRLNSTNVLLKKLSSMRDLNLILSDYRLDVSKEQLQKMYKECTQNFEDFFHIDVATNDDTMRFRKNFTEPLDPQQFL